MTDEEILEEFVRTNRSGEGTAIEVASISWPSPHEPRIIWAPAQTLPPNALSSLVEEARMAALHDTRFFHRCDLCKELNPLGWMHDERICQGCAAEHHGVVY